MNHKKEISINITLTPSFDHKKITLEMNSDQAIEIGSSIKALSNFIKHSIKKYNLDPSEVLATPDDYIGEEPK